MFGKYRGNTTATAGEADAGREAAPSPSKSRRPMLRTLEPRMVFDAAAAATAEHVVAAPPPHPPAGEAAHPPVSDLAWTHLAENLKPAPPPIDKSAVTEGPAAIKPIAIRMVYEAAAPLLRDGIHALQISALTPAEAATSPASNSA